MDERLKKIADHYKLEMQELKLIEEMAELTQAIIKGDKNHVYEELADVEIMLAQVKYLGGYDQGFINYWKEVKINRQLKRIADERKEKD